MDLVKGAVAVIGATIILVTLATGPIGLLSIEPADSGFEGIGSGNATVTVLSTPDEVTIRESGTGQDVYYLEVPPARVEVSDLNGNPLLTYSLSIEEMGYTVDSLNPLGELGEGTHEITIDRRAFEAHEIDRDQYQGTLELVLRGDAETVEFTQNVTIEVQHDS